jgi:hypothetical protein
MAREGSQDTFIGGGGNVEQLEFDFTKGHRVPITGNTPEEVAVSAFRYSMRQAELAIKEMVSQSRIPSDLGWEILEALRDRKAQILGDFNAGDR